MESKDPDEVPIPELAGDADERPLGDSQALLDVRAAVRRVAPTAATVLVTGEAGTGKELVARQIHRLSPGAEAPFVPVDCTAPEAQLEPALFGALERARGGTVFLDEIGELPAALQARLLRALQDRAGTSARLISATRLDLPARIEAGAFREDLFYRLAVVRLHLPPLRERGRDVRALALHFAAATARAHDRPLRAIAAAALDRLSAHSWPGNVRELRGVVERAAVLADRVIRPEHVRLDAQAAEPPAPPPPDHPLPGYSPTLSLAEVEALHIAEVLRHVDGHYGRAAEILGVHRNTVSRKAQQYGIAGE